MNNVIGILLRRSKKKIIHVRGIVKLWVRVGVAHEIHEHWSLMINDDFTIYLDTEVFNLLVNRMMRILLLMKTINKAFD
jgi:hypothetical protein